MLQLTCSYLRFPCRLTYTTVLTVPMIFHFHVLFRISPDFVKIFMLALVSYFMTSSQSCLYWTRYSTPVERTRTCFSRSPQHHSGLPPPPHVSSLTQSCLAIVSRPKRTSRHKKVYFASMWSLVLFFFVCVPFCSE